MVILFSGRKSRAEKEIIKILTQYGGDYISDKAVCGSGGLFTVISEYRKTEIVLNKGLAVFCDNAERFRDQLFPQGMIGICEDSDRNALEIIGKSRIPVISCGMNPKNTVTLSSLDKENILLTLQRSFTDLNGCEILPGEFKIKLNGGYMPFSVMASAAVLLLNGIIPEVF